MEDPSNDNSMDEVASISLETTSKIIKIGEKNNLHFDQTGFLSDAVNWVLDGQIPASSFKQNIVSLLKIDDYKAATLAQDVNEQIFKPVQESLRKMQGEAGKANVEEVHLSREDLLHQLENPIPTPLSGRRAESDESRFTIHDSRIGLDAESGKNTDDALAQEMQKAMQTEEQQGNVVPINKPAQTGQPQSILEKKMSKVNITNKDEAPADPYREATG
ncbi:MAG: hypothetical protein WC764_02385 [Candidatus Paceibacterota bacterium]|jgi:hypothetical protein